MSVSNQQYEELDKLNLCHRCKKNEQFYGRKHCPECLEKMAVYSAKRYGTGSHTLAKNNERLQRYVKRHKEDGLCIKCSKIATHGMYCYEHSIRAKRNNAKNAENKKRKRHEKGLITEYRKEHNLCCFCGEPVDTAKHGQACSKCANAISERSRYYKNLAGTSKNDWLFQPVNNSIDV